MQFQGCAPYNSIQILSSQADALGWSISRKAVVEKRILALSALYFFEKLFKMSHLEEICNTLNISFKNIDDVLLLVSLPQKLWSS